MLPDPFQTILTPAGSPPGTGDRERHWSQIYRTKAPTEVSWYQPSPDVSLALIERSGIARSGRIIDVGGGASTLVDSLVARGYQKVTVLDIAASALDAAKRRLRTISGGVRWVVADVLTWQPDAGFDLWHDRAVFHFLLADEERHRYVAALRTALQPGGTVILATFALDGPERCSGLPVRRHSPDMLVAELGDGFALVETAREDHRTPAGAVQRFVYCRFRRELGSPNGTAAPV